MAATGKVLGTVTSVVGEAKATAADGTVRVLQVGDVVHGDEVITTSAAGAINIALESGKTLDCGANTDLSLHESILGLATATAASPAAPGSVEALQQAIASGQDPSQIAPATAAGGAPGAGGATDGGGGTPVILEQANTSSVVTSGFPTEGGTITFPLPEFQLLPAEEEEQAPAVSVSVQVQVQVQVQVEISVEGQPNVVSGPAEGGVFAVSASGDAVSLIEGTMEGTMMIPFVITLDKVFDTDVQVTYQIVPDSASAPSDFFDGVLTATVTIPAGSTSFTVPIQIVRDHLVEANESFSIVLIDAVNATINPDNDSASVTIFNDDANPVANNDTSWAQEDAHVTAAGNVLQDQPHAGAPSGSFTDAADTDFEPLTVTNPGTYVGTYGTLVLGANGSYVYTLNNANTEVQALDSGETRTDPFNYSVTDGFNTPDSATLTITIFGSNDAPVAIGDTNSMTEDQASVSGNVITNDTDVDNEPLTVVADPITLNQAMGTLVIQDSGSYTFTLSAAGVTAAQALSDGENFVVAFADAYRNTDGDANSNLADVTITVTGLDDGVEIRDLTPSTSGGEATVLEADLSDGSSPDAAALTKSGDFTISAPDGVASLTIGGTAVITNGVFSAATITTALGNTLNVTSYNATTGVVSYSYTLNDDETHANANGANNLFDNSAVVLVDEDGDTANSTLSIQIVDDLPASAAPSGTIENDVGETLVGLIQYDMNADDLGTVTLTVPTVTSNGSPLTLTSHGSSIVYQVTDTNGDGMQELYARADTDGDGTKDDVVFILAPNTPADPDGAYTLTMFDVVDLPVPVITTSFSEVTASGPVDKLAVYDDASHTSAHLLVSTPQPAAHDVNPSQGFIGIDNNVMNTGETITYEFGTVNTSNLTITHEDVNDVKLTIFDTGTGTNAFTWIALKDGVQVGDGSISFANNVQPAAVHVDGGYDTLQFTVTSTSDFKVGGLSYSKLGAAQDVNLAMTFGGADADGDPISGSFNITITGGDGTAESHILQQLLNQP